MTQILSIQLIGTMKRRGDKVCGKYIPCLRYIYSSALFLLIHVDSYLSFHPKTCRFRLEVREASGLLSDDQVR
jgi:hypothetical protein